MPKITRHGGPSDKADITETTGEDTPPEATPAGPAEAPEATVEEPAVKATPRRRTRSKS
ncbi:hypothetical protein [Streptomyces sp. NPDC053367]|uniref:hypothetical protein n=1 Tax=Streptomyces sp. NPDC053367 TaxID=3365700 RepID=UPI0037CD5E85